MNSLGEVAKKISGVSVYKPPIRTQHTFYLSVDKIKYLVKLQTYISNNLGKSSRADIVEKIITATLSDWSEEDIKRALKRRNKVRKEKDSISYRLYPETVAPLNRLTSNLNDQGIKISRSEVLEILIDSAISEDAKSPS